MVARRYNAEETYDCDRGLVWRESNKIAIRYTANLYCFDRLSTSYASVTTTKIVLTTDSVSRLMIES